MKSYIGFYPFNPFLISCLRVFISEESEDSFNATEIAVNGSTSVSGSEQMLNKTEEEEVESDVNDDDDDDDQLAAESQPRNHSTSSKNKREQRHQNHQFSSSSSSDAAAAADFQHTKFGVALTHHVTAFITWPQSPDAACSRGRKVVGYQLRYRLVGDSDYISHYLSENLLMLDELMPNQRYRYQLQYVTEPPGESLWSQEAELDTTT